MYTCMDLQQENILNKIKSKTNVSICLIHNKITLPGNPTSVNLFFDLAFDS